MDLVSGVIAMDFWEITPEELAGIAFVCDVPCVCCETYKEAYPPHMLGLESMLKEAYDFALNLYRLAHSLTCVCEALDASLINIERLLSAHNILSSKNMDRSKEIEDIKSLLFDKAKLYYAICNSKSFGGPLHFISSKRYLELKKENEGTEIDLLKIKDFLYYFSYQHVLLFDNLQSSMQELKNYDEIKSEIESIVRGVVHENDRSAAKGINGAAILRRWEGTALDIKKALREGALVPVNKLPGDSADSGPRRIKSIDPCLYCEDGPVGGECEYLSEGYSCLSRTPEEQLFRINNEIFLRDEVERYEEGMGFRHDNGQLRIHQQPESPSPTTPLEYVELWRSQGVRDHKELAARIDDIFIDDHKLSNRALGQLLPANPGCEITPRGQTDRGKRLRGLKK